MNTPSSHRCVRRAEFVKVFKRHLQWYGRQVGESALIPANAEASARLQYSGRVAYELLQNALDRAVGQVQLGFADNGAAFFVANDGAPVTLDPNFDLDHPSAERADLHALLSLHTSNKRPGEALGNKGIGFRSVFGVADRVRVWSRLEDGGWWGVELCWQPTPDLWRERAHDPDAITAVGEIWPGEDAILGMDAMPRASFALPVPLLRETPPLPEAAAAQTIVILPISSDRAIEIRSQIAELRSSRLHFVGLHLQRRRERSSTIAVHLEGGSVMSTHPGASAWVIAAIECPSFAGLARKAGHPLSSPGVAVAWPPAGPLVDTWVYNHLPTRRKPDFPIDVHADFQVQADRGTLITDGSDVGKYNASLIRVAAELHLRGVLNALGVPTMAIEWTTISPDPTAPHPDIETIWHLLSPVPGRDPFLIHHIQSLLFPQGSPQNPTPWRRWAALAGAFFNPERPAWRVPHFRSFWDASTAWVTRLSSSQPHTKTWANVARALCDALRDARVECIPLIEHADDEGEACGTVPPERPDGHGDGTSALRRVFLRRPDAAGNARITLPAALAANGRYITAFQLGSFDHPEVRPTGVVDFGRWLVLQQLRQLPNGLPRLRPPIAEDHALAVEHQQQLILLAAELYMLEIPNSPAPARSPEQFRFAWRVLPDPDAATAERLRAGRALATLFLPIAEGLWAPARQLNAGEVDVARLRLFDGVDIDGFLAFLGVAPRPPAGGASFALVEGGDAGRIVPVMVPPALCATTNAHLLPVALTGGLAEGDLSASLLAAWPKGLREIIAHEPTDGSREATVREQLRDILWVPASALSPLAGHDRVESVPARRIVLHRGHDPRAAIVCCLRREDPALADVLNCLGAIGSLADNVLRDKEGAAAEALLLGLREDLPAPELADAAVRRHLVALVEDLMGVLASCGRSTPLPLLVYRESVRSLPLSERTLGWCASDESSWIAENSTDREIVRRFFPRLALAVFTLGSTLVQKIVGFGARRLKVSMTVPDTEARTTADDRVQQLAHRLDAALPGLLALAHASRLAVPDVSWVALVWPSAPPLRWVEDAWVNIALEGPNVSPHPWRRGQNGDVLFVEVGGSRFIVFDATSNGDLPPLSEFGDALAELLVHNRALGPLFSRAVDLARSPDAWARLLEREGATDLEEHYRTELKPLSASEESDLREEVMLRLETVGVALARVDVSPKQLRALGASDLRPKNGEWGDLYVGQIEDALNSRPWPGRLALHRPGLHVIEEHRAQWANWFGANGISARMDAYANRMLPEQDAPGIDILGREREEWLAAHAFRRLDFSPAGSAVAWLRHRVGDLAPATPEDLDEALRAFAPRYHEVVRIHGLDACGWTARALTERGPSQGELAPQTLAARQDEQAAKAATGADAELVLLEFVARETHRLLTEAEQRGKLEAAVSALVGALPARGSRTQTALTTALTDWRTSRKPEALQSGLHVSVHWGNAGFDIVGLEESDGAFCAVRYECKGLPAESGPVAVHFSLNELRRARDTARCGKGRWVLVGVEPSGRAVDLSPLLDVLLDEEESLLAPLRQSGLEPEGMILMVRRR